MSYTALYRKFRPLKFEDMVGQEHITRTLRNQIISGRVGHAYLFNGGRGTGKTTSAKILARAVNCLNPIDGEPCNECEICKEILDGSLTDVVEMDAASNNSVEDIRSIREEVNFLPTKAKYRVYIIDEVHMLSVGAFNALLKTLEEPPEHVKFILATTEPQKLPTTILSRCQRFDYKKIGDNDVIKRLKIICENSDIKITEDALKIIAVLSEGAMRDAISILERCAQENIEEIQAKDIKELVGLPSLEYIHRVAEGMCEYDEVKALEGVNDVINNGKDIYNFLWELIKYFKDILVMKATNKLELYSEEEIVGIKRLSDLTDKDRLVDIIYDLSETANEIKWSQEKNIMTQVAVIKLCRKKTSLSGAVGDSLEKRFQALEEEIKKLQEMRVVGVEVGEAIGNAAKRRAEGEGKEEKVVKRKEPIPEGKANEAWKNILDNLKKSGKIRLFTCLINTHINEISSDVWEIYFPNGLTAFNEKILQDAGTKNDLAKEILKETGKEILIKYKDGKESKKEDRADESEINSLDIDVNIIE